jgi:hypothetical protein
MSRKALRRSAGKALSVDIYERCDHRYHVVWKDETGKGCFASRGPLPPLRSSTGLPIPCMTPSTDTNVVVVSFMVVVLLSLV